ncbi:MAG: hypothetical protein ACRD1F_11865 [Terriglobales bacterium]
MPAEVLFRGGGFLDGVPARNLTAEDCAALGPDRMKEALMSGLYEAAPPPSAPDVPVAPQISPAEPAGEES